MTLEEFRRFADTWGGDIERWPHSCRNEAKQCAATEEGGAILHEARRLDALLATAPVVTSERTSRAVFAVAQQIAAALDIAEYTVKNHVKNILAKLGVEDRTQAAMSALQRGIVHLE